MTTEGFDRCPFCGSDDVSMSKSVQNDLYKTVHYFVECCGCAAMGPESLNETTALAYWNKAALRAQPSAPCVCAETSMRHCPEHSAPQAQGVGDCCRQNRVIHVDAKYCPDCGAQIRT